MDLDPEEAVAMRAMWVALDLDAKKAMLTDDDPEKVRLAIKAWDVLLEMKDWGWDDDDEHGHPHGEDGDPEVPEGALPAQDKALIPLLIARMTLSDEALAEVNAGGLPREVIASTMEDPTAPKYIRPDAGGTLNSLVRVYGGEALAEVLRVVHADLAIAEADPTQWHAKERAIYTLGTVVSVCGLKDRGVEALGDGIGYPDLGPLGGGGSARSVWGPNANVPDVERMLAWLHDEHWLIRASAAWTLSMCSWLLSPLKDFGNGPDPSTAPFQKVVSSFLDYIRIVVEAEEREKESKEGQEGKEGKEGKEGILGVGGGGEGDEGKVAMSEKNPFHLFMVCTVIDTLISRRGVGALLARDHLRSMVGVGGEDGKDGKDGGGGGGGGDDKGSNGGHASLLGGLVWAMGALWRLDVPFVGVFDAIQGTLHNGSLHEKVRTSSLIVYTYCVH